jgi:glyoxylase-like metal-dependent hydrolase (beta-lactamase superfamily II)
LYEYIRSLKAIGFRFEQIKWAIISHFHLDHAGLVRDFQDAGIQCLLFENQGEGIDEMERIIARSYSGYRPILKEGFHRVSTQKSRSFLKAIGIKGEVIQTPGHSDDSVSLITDDHDAVIGDLYPIDQVMPNDLTTLNSWEKIRERGAVRIWPSHAPGFKVK